MAMSQDFLCFKAGLWFFGKISLDEKVMIAEDISEAIELQSCQGRSRPVLDGGGVDRPKLNLFYVTVSDT
jgi:hypothetical protein